MSFSLKLLDPISFEKQEFNGSRIYSVDGKKFPSITTILSRTADKTGLDEWRARVGVDAANDISRKSTKHGTELHLLMENFLYGHEIPTASFKTQQTFKLLAPLISKRVTNIYGIEQSLYSNQLSVAGQTDLICDFNGIPSILDWKTNKEVGKKNKKWCMDYYLQATFYHIATKELYGLETKQGVLVFCNPFGISFEIFEFSDFIEPIHKRIEMFYKMVDEKMRLL